MGLYNFIGMKFILQILPFIIILFFWSCGSEPVTHQEPPAQTQTTTPEALREEDEKIIAWGERIMAVHYSDSEIGVHLDSVIKAEDTLFEKVKRTEFKDPTEYNYWHRGRMKFPSKARAYRDALINK